MTRIQFTDLVPEFEAGLTPAFFSVKFDEAKVAHDEMYEALEEAYQTERSLELEQTFEDGTVEALSYNVTFRRVENSVITFTFEDANYPQSSSGM